MRGPYPGDLRIRVIEFVEAGGSRRDAAEHFEVSASSAIRWLQRFHEDGTFEPMPRGGGVSPLGIREQGRLDTTRLVFIDETAITTNMVRLNGWGPRGERLVADAPMGHWETVTFIAGLRQTGIVAPMLIKGAMNGEAFLAYIEQCLAPTLKHGDIVVADNVSF